MRQVLVRYKALKADYVVGYFEAFATQQIACSYGCGKYKGWLGYNISLWLNLSFAELERRAFQR